MTEQEKLNLVIHKLKQIAEQKHPEIYGGLLQLIAKQTLEIIGEK